MTESSDGITYTPPNTAESLIASIVEDWLAAKKAPLTPAAAQLIARPPYAPERERVAEDDKRWEMLREPFPDHQIGHKPQPWCRACLDAAKKHCDNHQLINCKVCRQRITFAHIDLDYVGHAAVTLRLLEVDPHWVWWPMPDKERILFDFPPAGEGGMWIWLDVLGHVRPGLGETEGGQLRGANRVKALMSDAIKNASMRFGVAIETWSKEDLAGNVAAAAEEADEKTRADAPPDPDRRDWAREFAAAETQEAFDALAAECRKAGEFEGAALASARSKKKQLDAAAKKAAETDSEARP